MINDKTQTATIDDVVAVSHHDERAPMCRTDVLYAVASMRKGYAVYLVQPLRHGDRGGSIDSWHGRGAIVPAAGPEGQKLCPLPNVGHKKGLILPPTGKRTPARIRYAIARHYQAAWGGDSNTRGSAPTMFWPIPYRDAGGKKVVPKEASARAREALRELEQLAARTRKLREEAKKARAEAKTADKQVDRAEVLAKTAAKAVRKTTATPAQEKTDRTARGNLRAAETEKRQADAAVKVAEKAESKASKDTKVAASAELKDWLRRRKMMVRECVKLSKEGARVMKKDRDQGNLLKELAQQYQENIKREDAHFGDIKKLIVEPTRKPRAKPKTRQQKADAAMDAIEKRGGTVRRPGQPATAKTTTVYSGTLTDALTALGFTHSKPAKATHGGRDIFAKGGARVMVAATTEAAWRMVKSHPQWDLQHGRPMAQKKPTPTTARPSGVPPGAVPISKATSRDDPAARARAKGHLEAHAKATKKPEPDLGELARAKGYTHKSGDFNDHSFYSGGVRVVSDLNRPNAAIWIRNAGKAKKMRLTARTWTAAMEVPKYWNYQTMKEAVLERVDGRGGWKVERGKKVPTVTTADGYSRLWFHPRSMKHTVKHHTLKAAEGLPTNYTDDYKQILKMSDASFRHWLDHFGSTASDDNLYHVGQSREMLPSARVYRAASEHEAAEQWVKDNSHYGPQKLRDQGIITHEVKQRKPKFFMWIATKKTKGGRVPWATVPAVDKEHAFKVLSGSQLSSIKQADFSFRKTKHERSGDSLQSRNL